MCVRVRELLSGSTAAAAAWVIIIIFSSVDAYFS
jgi:hypothetical protein